MRAAKDVGNCEGHDIVEGESVSLAIRKVAQDGHGVCIFRRGDFHVQVGERWAVIVVRSPPREEKRSNAHVGRITCCAKHGVNVFEYSTIHELHSRGTGKTSIP